VPSQWGPLEVTRLHTSQLADEERDQILTAITIEVIPWQPGILTPPQLSLAYIGPERGSHGLTIPPPSIEVASVLPAGELPDKRDLKPQAILPKPAAWPWLLGALVSTVGLLVAVRRLLPTLRRGAQSAPTEPQSTDDRSPAEIAYQALERIEALNLPSRGAFIRHYTLLANCLRNYIEGRFCIPAMDRTTSEVLADLRQGGPPRPGVGADTRGPTNQAMEADDVQEEELVDEEAQALLASLLQVSDLVKFARARPAVDDAVSALSIARRFIDLTWARSKGEQEIRTLETGHHPPSLTGE
jgi:hypothetical protein